VTGVKLSLSSHSATAVAGNEYRQGDPAALESAGVGPRAEWWLREQVHHSLIVALHRFNNRRESR
jgi:hypothetical protein